MAFGKRRRKTHMRAYVTSVAAEVYGEGDTEASLARKVKARIAAENQDRPLLRALAKLIEALIPFLLKLLSGLGV